jgi:hypothetical protein
MCHGSRLICDQDVYNKQYKVTQQLLFPELETVHSICSYDRDTLIIGTSAYMIAFVEYEQTTNEYRLLKKYRFEKSTHGEGDMVHIERINHMPAWFVTCSFRSLRFFKVLENEEA